MDFKVTPLKIAEVLLVEHERYGDERGFFAETYRADIFAKHGIAKLVQDNHSRSAKGVLRGLHFQNDPAAMGKLVRCTRGTIFDVAVDLRQGSPTFAQWVGHTINQDDTQLLWIPPGFAHGFAALSEVADLMYRTSAYYSPQHDRAVVWNDPDIGIAWPIEDPVLSKKDAAAPCLRDCDANFVYREASSQAHDLLAK